MPAGEVHEGAGCEGTPYSIKTFSRCGCLPLADSDRVTGRNRPRAGSRLIGWGKLSWRSFACTDGRMAEIYPGSCLCAKVRFELIGPPKAVSHCHCSQCRKGHGALFATYGSVPRSALRVLEGSSQIKAYVSSQKVVREFCMECGSTLFWSRSHGEFADWVSIALGTLDTPFIPHKQKHVHADAAAHWYTPASD